MILIRIDLLLFDVEYEAVSRVVVDDFCGIGKVG